MNKIRTMSVLVILAIIFSFATVRPATAACASSGSKTVTTDKADYGPHETAAISGSGFDCAEALSVRVTAPDGSTFSGDGLGSPGPDSLTTDDNGAFLLSYHLAGTLPNGGTYAGQLGTYTVEVMNSSTAVLASTTFTDGGNDLQSCAVTTSGGAKCWGFNFFGQVGDGTALFSAPHGVGTPVDVIGLTSGVAQISTGTDHTCAVTTNGGAKCWGANASGALGDGSHTTSYTPVDVFGLTSGVTQISAATFQSCAVTTSGGAKCWGNNGFGLLGDSTFTSSIVPVDVNGLSSGVAQISAGWYHTCALTTSGGVKCWGANFYGELGDGTFTGSNTPIDVNGLTNGVIQISAGGTHTCALLTTGGVKCWGTGGSGQLGNGSLTLSPPYGIATPVDVSGLTSGVAQISAGQNHTCALTTGGAVKCWGSNSSGALGDGTFTTSATPVDVSGLTGGVTQISAGAEHTCALTTSGGDKCWGYNSIGSLGDGTFTTSATPVDVFGLTNGVAFLPEIVGNTRLGNNSSVQPVDTTAGTTPVTLTFSQVTQSGTTSLTTSSSGPAPPVGFKLGNPHIYYELTTTAVFSGTITLCIDYTGTSFENDPTLTLQHLEGGNWQNRTSFFDSVNHIICASVTSLSPFAIFESVYHFSGFFQPVDNLPTLNSVNAGRAIPVKFSLGGDHGLNIFAAVYPKSEQIACNSSALVDGIEETVAPGSSTLTYDAGSDQYTYVWKTQKSWANTCRQLVVKLIEGTTQRANFKFK